MLFPSTKTKLFSRYWHQLSTAVTIAILVILYLPRLLTIGTFTDGPTYAILARNMAVGYGSWWAPQYGEIDSYWIEGIRGDVFYEHPPLMLILESLLFNVFGDHWWIEELFSGIVILIFFWFLIKIWNVLHAGTALNDFRWLAVLVVSTIPTVRFCISSNYLDGLLLVFLLFSFYHVCRTILEQKSSGLYWAGLGIFLGFLTKGPFALFLFAAPLLYCLSARNIAYTFPRAVRQTVFLVTLFSLLMGALLLYPPARSFFGHYFNQQILTALQGTRPDYSQASLSNMGHFYILSTLVNNLTKLLIISGLIWGLTRWRFKRSLVLSDSQYHVLIWLVLIGLSGILPILASQKQNDHYITPVVPFIGLALVTLQARALVEWLKNKSKLPPNWFQLTSVTGIMTAVFIIPGICLYFNVHTGTPLDRQQGMKQILSLQRVPVGSLVAVADRNLIKTDWVLNMNLQRYHRISLTLDTTRTPYRLSRISQGPVFAKNFNPIETVPNFDLQFWRKKKP